MGAMHPRTHSTFDRFRYQNGRQEVRASREAFRTEFSKRSLRVPGKGCGRVKVEGI